MSKTSASPRPDRGTYTVICGIDVAREAHHAVALDRDGHRLLDRPLLNAEPDLIGLFEELEGRGRVNRGNTVSESEVGELIDPLLGGPSSLPPL